MAEVFVTKDEPHNLRSGSNLVLPRARSSLYSTDTIRFIGYKLRQILPREIKESQSLEIFKRNIKSIKMFDCSCITKCLIDSCKLCKSFIPKSRFFEVLFRPVYFVYWP